MFSQVAARVPLHSSRTGAAVTEAGTGADHWCDDGRPDRFADAVSGLLAAGRRVFVEIGTHPRLGAAIRGAMERAGTIGAVIPTLPPGRPNGLRLPATRLMAGSEVAI